LSFILLLRFLFFYLFLHQSLPFISSISSSSLLLLTHVFSPSRFIFLPHLSLPSISLHLLPPFPPHLLLSISSLSNTLLSSLIRSLPSTWTAFFCFIALLLLFIVFLTLKSFVNLRAYLNMPVNI